MRRKVFDVLASLGGLVVVVMLVVAAAWRYGASSQIPASTPSWHSNR